MLFSMGKKMSRWRQEQFTRVFLTYFLSNLTQSHVSEKDFLLRSTEADLGHGGVGKCL